MGRRTRLFKFSLLMAFRSMSKRKLRSALTIIGILVGITTFVSLISITLGMRTQIEDILRAFIGAPIIVTSEMRGTRPEIPEETVNIIAGIPHVTDTAGLITNFMTVEGEFAPVVGIDPEKLQLMVPVQVIEGRELKNRPEDYDKCVCGYGLKLSLGKRIGDKIVLSGLISSGTVILEIVGFLSSTGETTTDSSIIMTLDGLQNIMATNNVQMIFVEVDDNAFAHSVAEVIRDAFPKAEVIESEQILAMANSVIQLINIVLGVMAGITLMVGAMQIMNSTMTRVLEETRSIGMIKSIGGQRSQVLQIFITEALIMSAIGGILGCLLSVVGVTILSEFIGKISTFGLPYEFPWWLFVVGISMSLGIGFISALYPSWRAASVKPVEALRYE
ncbi:MAG: ABC transporter permease [Candidatus Helarchaeota archaeon]|nr:ABC transporter permease [Candidatus Helarchaeota archaeon]